MKANNVDGRKQCKSYISTSISCRPHRLTCITLQYYISNYAMLVRFYWIHIATVLACFARFMLFTYLVVVV